jgi:hypothetical protein
MDEYEVSTSVRKTVVMVVFDAISSPYHGAVSHASVAFAVGGRNR